MNACNAEDCANPVWAKRRSGYCVMHQRRVDRHGDPYVVNGYRSTAERFLDNVVALPSGCIVWAGTINDRGYGRFYAAGRQWPAHTWAYQHFVGPLPDGCEPDHLCRERACVNTDHLEPVTHRENSQRAAYAQKLCKHGHALPEPGSDGRRVCRPCANERNRAYKARRALVGDSA